MKLVNQKSLKSIFIVFFIQLFLCDLHLDPYKEKKILGSRQGAHIFVSKITISSPNPNIGFGEEITPVVSIFIWQFSEKHTMEWSILIVQRYTMVRASNATPTCQYYSIAQTNQFIIESTLILRDNTICSTNQCKQMKYSSKRVSFKTNSESVLITPISILGYI